MSSILEYLYARAFYVARMNRIMAIAIEFTEILLSVVVRGSGLTVS